MASTFFGLSIAGSGLRAANAAMNTTANNISNADTQGYSRQRVKQEAANALRVFTTYGCAGAGVKTLAIERIRDEFYDVKYRENETSYGEYSSKNYYMQMIQEYFNDDGKTGFTTVFTNLKTSLQEVMKDSGSATSKQDFVGAAMKLMEYFNTAAGNLEKMQKDVNDEIKIKVDEINSLSQEIMTMNKQINVVELSGAQANELRDKRDNLVDQLSKIVDVEVKEYPIYDSNDPDRETGATRFMVRIAGGQKLVDNDTRQKLECVSKDPADRVNQSDIVGLYDIYWVGGDKFNTTNSRMGGELAGLFQIRDGNNGENFTGKVADIGDKTVEKKNPDGTTEDVTIQTVEVSVEKDYLQDLNKSNLANSGTINIGNKLFQYTGWTYNVEVEEDATSGKKTYRYSYTFELAEGEDASGRAGTSASTGSSIDYQGIPYYMQQMNEWLRLFSRSVNSIMQDGYTDDGKPGCLMFTSNNTDGTQADYDDADNDGSKDSEEYEKIFSGEELAAGEYHVSVAGDSYYQMTAKNFSILKAIEKNAELIATKTDPKETDGESQYDNIKLIANTLTDAKKLSFRGADAGEFLTCVLGDIILAKGNAETFEDTYTVLRKSLENQRLSISGVDTDEEALSLVHYQDSYTLASKMISTFAEIYDRLILETGV